MALRITTASTIDCGEIIENRDPRIGAAPHYYPAIVYRNVRRVDTGEVDSEGFPLIETQRGRFREVALFTEAGIEEAIKRGNANREDVERWLAAERREGIMLGAALVVGLLSTAAVVGALLALLA